MSDHFDFLNTLAESRLFPSITAVHKYDAQDAADLAYLYIISLRILLCDDDTLPWAKQYCRRTTAASDFKHWRTDGSDLYVMLHALVDEKTIFADSERNHHRTGLRASSIWHWLYDAARDDAGESKTRRLFTSLDTLFHVTGGSMKAVRRLAQDWPSLHEHDRRLCMTRLLQMIRARGSKSEILPLLQRLARHADLEIDDVCNRETGENCDQEDSRHDRHLDDKPRGMGLLRSLALTGIGAIALNKLLAKESASSGSTSSANVAVVAGGIGAGFDPNGDHGVYQSVRKDKKPSKPLIIRRGDAPKSKIISR